MNRPARVSAREIKPGAQDGRIRDAQRPPGGIRTNFRATANGDAVGDTGMKCAQPRQKVGCIKQR